MQRLLLLIGLALVFGGIVSALFYRRYFIRERGGGEFVSVIVADRAIAFGEPMRSEWLTVRELPEDYVEERHIPIGRRSDLIGLPLVRSIRAGETIMQTDLSTLSAYGRTLSAEIPSGERAITLRVDATSTFNGLLRAGDRVDALLVASASESEQDQDLVCTVLLENALVLAVAAVLEGQTEAAGRGAQPVTLRISPADGARLALARIEGDIHLLLRNPMDEALAPSRREVSDPDLLVQARRERFLFRDRRSQDAEAGLAALAPTATP